MDPATLAVATSEIIKQGIVGVFCVLILFVVIALWRAYVAAQAAKLADAQANTDRYVKLLETMIESQADTNTVLKIIEDRARASRRS
jgi:hypothetical protein